MGQLTNFAAIIKMLLTNSYEIFSGNKPLDFGTATTASDHDPGSGIFSGIFNDCRISQWTGLIYSLEGRSRQTDRKYTCSCKCGISCHWRFWVLL